jgi:hypothetical protein
VSERRNAGHFSVLGSRPHKGATEEERKRLLLWASIFNFIYFHFCVLQFNLLRLWQFTQGGAAEA